MNVMNRFDIDRPNNRLIFKRTVNASAAKIFDAWTTPEKVTKWWDPSGAPLADCTIDLRVGGSFSFVNAGEGQHPFTGTYTVIDRPTDLVFEAMGATGHIRLTEEGGVALMVVEMTCASAEHLEQFVRMGIGDGTATTLDNLRAFAEG